MRILFVTNDKSSSSRLKTALESEYNSVDQTKCLNEGFSWSRKNSYDVIVYDYDDKLEEAKFFCRDLRISGNNTPIIVTSYSEEVFKRIMFLNSGADDFLIKPFSFEEFLARLRSLTRRNNVSEDQIFEIDDLIVNVTQYTVLRSGNIIKLTKKEFDLLKILLERRGAPISRKIILELVWDTNAKVESNTVDLHIHKLRNKIGDTKKNRLIHAIPGVGYLIK